MPTNCCGPPQPRRDKGLAVAAANPFDVSAPVLHPLHRVTGDVCRSVGATSLVRRERREFGVTNFPRQSAWRTKIRWPSRSTSSHRSPRSSPRHMPVSTAHKSGAHWLVRCVEEPPDLRGLEGGRSHDGMQRPRPRCEKGGRLFYVGLTRARHEVHMTYSGWYENAYGKRFIRGLSRFLARSSESNARCR